MLKWSRWRIKILPNKKFKQCVFLFVLNQYCLFLIIGIKDEGKILFDPVYCKIKLNLEYKEHPGSTLCTTEKTKEEYVTPGGGSCCTSCCCAGKENGNVSLPETPVDNQEIEKDSDNVAFLDNEEEVEEEEQLSGDDGGGSKVTVQ